MLMGPKSDGELIAPIGTPLIFHSLFAGLLLVLTSVVFISITYSLIVALFPVVLSWYFFFSLKHPKTG